MTLRKIARLGHPVLLARAAPVDRVADPAIQTLIDDMIETMRDADGIGLAAPQVHESLRIIVACDIRERGPIGPDAIRVLINPELQPQGEEVEQAYEGCLSIPDLRGLVPRARRVRYTALDRHGEPVAGEAQGLFARVLQHEVDHLDGILYLMRMPDLRHLGFAGELRHMTSHTDAAGDDGT